QLTALCSCGEIAADFDLIVLRHSSDHAVAVDTLNLLGLFHGDVEADSKIVGEGIAADRQRDSMRDRAFEKDRKLGGARPDTRDADAEFALIRREHGFGG